MWRRPGMNTGGYFVILRQASTSFDKLRMTKAHDDKGFRMTSGSG
jgi:hypothetical protein